MAARMGGADDAGRSRWIPWAFVAFFGVVFVANAAMIAVAFWSWTGVEAKSPYRRGLDYNRVLEAERAQAALGWQVALDVAEVEKGRVRLDLTLVDAHGGFIEGADVEARFVRPTHEGHDFEVVVPRWHGGTYRAEVGLPLPGQWDVRLEVAANGATWRASERINVVP